MSWIKFGQPANDQHPTESWIVTDFQGWHRSYPTAKDAVEAAIERLSDGYRRDGRMGLKLARYDINRLMGALARTGQQHLADNLEAQCKALWDGDGPAA